MSRLRLAVVGCGAISTASHIPAIRACADAVLTAVVDRDLEWARAVARRAGAEIACSGVGELRGRVDAAVVATPSASHASITRELLASDIHVLCEKPFATSLADAQAVARAVGAGGARVMAGHVRRFQPNLRAVARLVQRGMVGTPETLALTQSSVGGRWPSRTSYRMDRRQAGGGVLMELGVHLVDLTVWLLGGAVERVDAHLSRPAGSELETDAELAIHLSSGAFGWLAVSSRRGLPGSLTLRGSEGWVTTPLESVPGVRFFARGARACRVDGAQTLRVPDPDPFTCQVAEFCRCLRDGTPFPVPIDDVLTGLELIQQVYAREADRQALSA